MDAFNCPITYEQMRDPVIAMDGHTYERAAIERWIAENRDRPVLSPLTGASMSRLLIPNYALKKAIEEYTEPSIREVEIRNNNIPDTLNDYNNMHYNINNIINNNLNYLNYINHRDIDFNYINQHT